MSISNKMVENVEKILVQRFPNDYVKQKVQIKNSSLRFSCPYCGDSKKSSYIKRGNFYFDSGFYHCFNCGRHLSGVSLLNYFNKEFTDYKLINDIKELNLKANISNLSLDINLDDINSIGIDLDTFIHQNRLYRMEHDHPFLKKRLMFHKQRHFAYKGNYVYIFNLYNNNIIGYQTRHISKKYYEKFPLSRIYEENEWLETPTINIDSFNKLSLVYDVLNIDTTILFTVFEGAINSWSYLKNSTGISSVVVNTDFLDVTGNARYFYDNDKSGRLKMIDKLSKGHYVFLWKKFLKENNITDRLNDMNDILKYFQSKKQLNKLLELDNYFSNKKYNLLYV